MRGKRDGLCTGRVARRRARRLQGTAAYLLHYLGCGVGEGLGSYAAVLLARESWGERDRVARESRAKCSKRGPAVQCDITWSLECCCYSRAGEEFVDCASMLQWGTLPNTRKKDCVCSAGFEDGYVVKVRKQNWNKKFKSFLETNHIIQNTQ
jgi:hypothetical protein